MGKLKQAFIETPEQQVERLLRMRIDTVAWHVRENQFFPYYGDSHRQAYDFLEIFERNGRSYREIFDICQTEGLQITEMETWYGIRFPDGTGLVITKADLAANRMAQAIPANPKEAVNRAALESGRKSA